MLTDAEIARLIEAGALVRWDPRLGERVGAQHRVILLLPTVATAIDNPRWPLGDGETTRGPKLRRQAFHAQLTRFVEGKGMVVMEEIKRLSRKDAAFSDLFSFRSRPPNPQVRLFGYFAKPAVFVGLVFLERDELDDDGRWLEMAKDASARWRALTASKAMEARSPVRTKAELARYIDD